MLKASVVGLWERNRRLRRRSRRSRRRPCCWSRRNRFCQCQTLDSQNVSAFERIRVPSLCDRDAADADDGDCRIWKMEKTQLS